VAPGVAIAAKHVIEQFLPQLSIEGGACLTCTSIIPSQLMVWNCRKITMPPDTDLAILILSYTTELPPDNTFTIAAITTRLPKVGEQVSMVGFTASDEEFPFDPVGYTVRGDVRVSVGTIKKRHATGRDKFLIPWPVLQIASFTSRGMSGGPVFDQRGHLLGIVSSCIETDDQMGPSYISLLWPALMTPIDAEWPNGVHVPGRSLHEFGRLCCIDHREALTRTSPTSWQYSPWE
jgi:Trypsin-like peptidase domain